MKRTFITICLRLLAAWLLTQGEAVSAQSLTFLDMSVSPSTLVASPGDSPLWDVQLINNNPDTAYFILAGFDDGLGAVPDISIPPYNPSPFGQQFTLAPSASFDLPNLFQTVISPSAGEATYVSTAQSLYTLYDSPVFDNTLLDGVTASADWTLTVSNASSPQGTPEPGAFAFITGLSISGGVLLLRHRKRFKLDIL